MKWKFHSLVSPSLVLFPFTASKPHLPCHLPMVNGMLKCIAVVCNKSAALSIYTRIPYLCVRFRFHLKIFLQQQKPFCCFHDFVNFNFNSLNQQLLTFFYQFKITFQLFPFTLLWGKFNFSTIKCDGVNNENVPFFPPLSFTVTKWLMKGKISSKTIH